MTIPTLLPIYTFAKVLGLHPLHVMQVDANIGSAASRVCIHPIQQYSWQDADGVSRDELAYAIASAEQELADYLGYWPAPVWVQDERVELGNRPGYWLMSSRDVRGDIVSCKAKYGQMISGGAKAKTLIDDVAAIVYTDVDLDTYFETATITCATTVTDPEEIHIYYPGLSGDDEWEIRPISVAISAGVATITCRREQLVIKTLLESLEAGAVGGLTNANFLTTVDVYRVYNDPSTQVSLVWRNDGWWSCCSDGCESCGLVIQTGCLTTKDKALGVVTFSAADWNADTATFSSNVYSECRRPDYVRLWYRAGFRDMSLLTPNITMSREWQRAVSILAISKLDRLICSCKAVSDVQSHWNTDLRRNVGTRDKTQSLKVTHYELESCPFGTTIGAIETWRLARRRTLGLVDGL